MGRLLRNRPPMGKEKTTMTGHRNKAEDLILLAVGSSKEALSMEEILARVPELSWGQAFFAIDAMSRRGGIILRRRGFSYEVSPPMSVSAAS